MAIFTSASLVNQEKARSFQYCCDPPPRSVKFVISGLSFKLANDQGFLFNRWPFATCPERRWRPPASTSPSSASRSWVPTSETTSRKPTGCWKQGKFLFSFICARNCDRRDLNGFVFQARIFFQLEDIKVISCSWLTNWKSRLFLSYWLYRSKRSLPNPGLLVVKVQFISLTMLPRAFKDSWNFFYF